MNRSSRTPLFLGAGLLASLVLSACGSSGGDTMSDEDKVKAMHKAHEVPLGPTPGAVPPPSKGGGAPSDSLIHP